MKIDRLNRRFGGRTTAMVGALLLAYCLAVPVGVAETSLRVTGEVRTRSEGDKKEFTPHRSVSYFTNARSRLLLEALVDGNTHGVIQFQDSRRLGGRTIRGEEESGSLSNGMNVDLHQAYVQIDQLWEGGPGLKIGRFELNLGNQRLFGAVGWSNVGRSWEGATSFWEGGTVGLTAFWLLRREDANCCGRQSFEILGANIELTDQKTELLLVYERDDTETPLPGGGKTNFLDRFTGAAYLQRRIHRFDVTINAAYQFGEMPFALGGIRNVDISAYLLTGELGMTVDHGCHSRFAAGFDHASGDDDLQNDTFTAFDNLYYTSHTFRGYMDYFVSSSLNGLTDIYVRYHVVPVPGWRLAFDVHTFGEAGFDSQLGTETDLTIGTTRVAGVKLDLGASAFFPSEDFGGPDSDPGLWLYGMATVSFDGKLQFE